MRRRGIRWGRVLAGLACVAVLLGLAVWGAVRHVPSFYDRALAIPLEEQVADSDEFLAEVSALAGRLRRPGEWSAIFTEDQINGWFAHDLVANHAATLPAGLSDPRIELRPEASRIACRWTRNGVPIVCSAEFDVRAGGPHQVALRLRSLRAGAIPLPRGQWVEEVSSWAVEARLPLRWMQAEGDPVAVVTLPQPTSGEHRGKTLRLETVRIELGRILVGGSTEPAALR